MLITFLVRSSQELSKQKKRGPWAHREIKKAKEKKQKQEEVVRRPAQYAIVFSYASLQ
jgi:hypothetical protein